MARKKCDRCHTNLSFLNTSSTMLKGGYSGLFCDSCMNAWNEAYHEIRLSMLSIMADKGNHSIAEMMEATTKGLVTEDDTYTSPITGKKV